jgi:hypothetical protein
MSNMLFLLTYIFHLKRLMHRLVFKVSGDVRNLLYKTPLHKNPYQKFTLMAMASKYDTMRPFIILILEINLRTSL